MANITFPFKTYLNNGYQEEIQTSYTETTPDAGSQYRRELFTDVGRSVTGTSLLTDSEKAQFDNFYLKDTRSGSNTFNWYDCINDVTRNARFLGKPSIVRNSNRWNVSYNLWLEPTTIVKQLLLSTEDGKLILTEDGKALEVDVEFNI